jgi:hypothetical protein
VNDYAISGNGRVAVFTASPPLDTCEPSEDTRREGIVIIGQSLAGLLRGSCDGPSANSQLFVSRPAQDAVHIPLDEPVARVNSLSPDGEYGLVSVSVLDFPPSWAGYDNELLRKVMATARRKGDITPWQRYLLLDTRRNTLVPLLDTPMDTAVPTVWAKDGSSVFLKAYLPLDVADPKERKERARGLLPVEVQMPGRVLRRITEEEWLRLSQADERHAPTITLEEDVNRPPKVYALVPGTTERKMILDLNPGFESLRLGRVETITWTVHGIEVNGGLYLPPDFVAGKRYPLVIQTHGYTTERFCMDGLQEWSGGFAARPLAANGVMVLQAFGFKNPEDHDRVGNDRTLGATLEQSFKKFAMSAYEGAIDALDQRGMIDRNRVGISGFSRTVSFVGYMLTHSNYKLAASILTNGTDAGYFQYVVFSDSAWDTEALNGGLPPSGEEGLLRWIGDSPSFRLEHVQSPLRLVALGTDSVLEFWEWFVRLTIEKKPVEFVEVPGASHLVERPEDRRIAMEGVVDWFRFWLKSEESADPSKAEQYRRWHTLRKQ